MHHADPPQPGDEPVFDDAHILKVDASDASDASDATEAFGGRDYGSIIFFQDLHKFFDGNAKELGSPLPPALAVYALCNALMTRGCTIERLIHNMHSPDFRKQLLSIVRDLVAPFTMCEFEGVYWEDKSCGDDVEVLHLDEPRCT